MQPQHKQESQHSPDPPVIPSSLAASALPRLAVTPVNDPCTAEYLPLRPFQPGMPPEAGTLWPFDLKLSYTAYRVTHAAPPALWGRMDHLMERLLSSWSSWLDGKTPMDLWEESQRHELGRRARAQAECVLSWQRELHQEGPVRGLLPKIPPLTLGDYPDTHLSVQEPLVLLPPLSANPDIQDLLFTDPEESPESPASQEVMALFDYHPASVEDFKKFDLPPEPAVYR